MGYQSYIKESKSDRVKLFFIFTLKDLTGQKLDENISLEIFDLFFNSDSLYLLKIIIKKLEIEITIFKKIESKVQKIFTEFITDGKFKDVTNLVSMTNIQPLAEVVQNGYRKYLEQGKIISFIGLKKETGINAEEAMIREIYKIYGQKADSELSSTKCKDEDNLWLKNIKKLQSSTGIDPKTEI